MDQNGYSRTEDPRSAEDASWKNCPITKEDRGRNPPEGVQPGSFIGFADLRQLGSGASIKNRPQTHNVGKRPRGEYFAVEVYRLGDRVMLWIILFVATCALLGLAFVPDLSL